ncbi:MAG: hypothetical protein KJO54_08450 [Gammaproteobacteria bacterium]|nr:hypothetical protein [Gammaproteobacteria bacterium]NNM21572.1 hypothetical protein [Gammaproteobacteria bacterium]
MDTSATESIEVIFIVLNLQVKNEQTDAAASRGLRATRTGSVNRESQLDRCAAWIQAQQQSQHIAGRAASVEAAGFRVESFIESINAGIANESQITARPAPMKSQAAGGVAGRLPGCV